MINKRIVTLGLTIVGAAGVGVTSWLSVRGHEKAKHTQDRKSELLCYAPAIASGALTIGCIFASHHISAKEIAALSASCGYLAANRKKIIEKVRKELGDEKTNAIQKEALIETKKEQKKEKKPSVVVEETGEGRVHFIEDMFGREFYCSLEHVEWAEKMINHMFMQGERVNYNTFYELLGLKKTRAGWENGWPLNEDIYGYSCDQPIYFENSPIELDNGERGYYISVRTTPPIPGYLMLED